MVWNEPRLKIRQNVLTVNHDVGQSGKASGDPAKVFFQPVIKIWQDVKTRGSSRKTIGQDVKPRGSSAKAIGQDLIKIGQDL